jgi:outer membrane protein assembly factor BamB
MTLRCKVCWIAMAVAWIVARSVAPAQEWSRFRGPNGSGIGQATGLPVTLQADALAWTVELAATGHSSPVLWASRLFITSADEQTGQQIVQCFDGREGKELWSQRFAGGTYNKHKKNSFATSTPAADAEHVYVCWAAPGDGGTRIQMAALHHDGTIAWQQDLGPFRGGHGFGASPIVYGDLVVLNNQQDGEESSILAVDRRSGALRWKTPRKSMPTTYSTPVVYDGRQGAELIFTNWQHGITSIDPSDGSVNWEISVFGQRQERAIGSPVVAGDLVIGSCGFVTAAKHTVAVRPPAAQGQQPEKVYEIERGAPHVPSLLVHDGRMYLWSDQGIVTCCDVATGQTKWQRRVGGNYSGSPVWADGRLYCVSEDGELVVLAAGDEFVVLGRSELGDLCHSTPAIALGRMYLRTAGKLFCVAGQNAP